MGSWTFYILLLFKAEVIAADKGLLQGMFCKKQIEESFSQKIPKWKSLKKKSKKTEKS